MTFHKHFINISKSLAWTCLFTPSSIFTSSSRDWHRSQLDQLSNSGRNLSESVRICQEWSQSSQSSQSSQWSQWWMVPMPPVWGSLSLLSLFAVLPDKKNTLTNDEQPRLNGRAFASMSYPLRWINSLEKKTSDEFNDLSMMLRKKWHTSNS